MRRQSWLWGFLFVCGMWCGAPASDARADDSMRCKNRLVSIGDTLYEVKSLCGPPDFTEQHVERRGVRNRVRAQCAPGVVCSSASDDSIEVTIDVWTYDFGKNRFVQYLTFEAGKLIAIRNGEYGHKQ